MNFSEFRVWFDDRFSFLLNQKIIDFNLQGENVDISTIISYIKTIAQDGKRFRPFLIYTASGLNCEDSDKHFLLFATIELLHVFALIHDDIMDEADARHGVQCAHKKFAVQYGDTTAQAVAILLGDIVFAWTYECLFEYTIAFPQFRDRITEEFEKLVREVMYGQLLDILSPTQAPFDEKTIIEKMTLKTARYSFVQPIRIGFVVRGDIGTDQSFAEAFGISLGIGFQIQDDLLDTELSAQTGKTRFLDIQSGQQTLLSWYMHHKVTPEEQKEFAMFFGKKNIPESVHYRLAELLDSSGAIAYVRNQAAKYFGEASNAIHRTRTDDSKMWNDILTLVQERKR